MVWFQKAECFRAAVDLTGLLLTQNGQGVNMLNQASKHTPYTLQVSNNIEVIVMLYSLL